MDTMSLQEIEENIMQLDYHDRAFLAYNLIKSIDDYDVDLSENEIENCWMDEVDRRTKDIGDESKFRDAKIVFTEAKKRNKSQ